MPTATLIEDDSRKVNATPLGRIWIDLDNSPHVPFFAPIIEELGKRGYSVFLTARDAFQVTELVDLFQMNCQPIGRHYGKNKVLKVAGTCYRALQLMGRAWREDLILALSHGSRSQLLAGTFLRIPTLVIFDYEFARKLTTIQPTWVMAPHLIPDSAIPFPKHRVLRYPGIKEDVYVPRFRPDPAILAKLGLTKTDLVVTMRPPATEAHYFTPKSDVLYRATMDFLGKSPNVRVVVVPRNGKQAEVARQTWPQFFASRKFIIPEGAVDGLNLLWFSDLAIGGGGTMNREAAALGVPVYSTFAGSIGAVDRYLSEMQRLTIIESSEEIPAKIKLRRRERSRLTDVGRLPALDAIVDNIIAALEARRRGPRQAVRRPVPQGSFNPAFTRDGIHTEGGVNLQ